MSVKGSVVLCILDGWGSSVSTKHNAIHEANTPVWDRLIESSPHSELQTSGLSVGLPDGQMGNSEVGHMNIGSGRIVMQELPRIDQAASDGSLAEMAAIKQMIPTLKETGKACHLLGLISPGGVHAHQNHIIALAKIVGNAGVKVCLHAFTDGRDVAPSTAKQFINDIESEIKAANLQDTVSFATLGGRYYGMDRDQRWDRIQKAYDAIIEAKGNQSGSVTEAIGQSYDNKVDDEFIIPTVIDGYEGARDGDAFIMSNFRSDRVRQILSAFVMPDFEGFSRNRSIAWSSTIGMVEYSSELTKHIEPLFPAQTLDNVLGELIATEKMTQLRISETEKYAHVTFFFNGGREQPFDGEDRILVSSPDVATYDLQPEMSSGELTEKLVDAIDSQKYDFIIVNYPNTDMVGHTGDIRAAILYYK